jgi:hypothetical protein
MFYLVDTVYAFAILLWMLICLCGLAACWTGVGRAKRFWQVTALALLGAFAWIPAPELTVTLAAQCATVWVGFAIGRRWLRSPEFGQEVASPETAPSDAGPFSFSLPGLLVAMLFAGAIAAPISAAKAPQYNWSLAGLARGVITLNAIATNFESDSFMAGRSDWRI